MPLATLRLQGFTVRRMGNLLPATASQGPLNSQYHAVLFVATRILYLKLLLESYVNVYSHP